MKIVSLLPSSTEIVCKLGFRENLVGVSHECDYPLSVKDLPILTKPRFSPIESSQKIDNSVQDLLKKGLSVYEVNTDLLKNLAPDLIITQAQCEACAVSLNDVKKAVSDWVGNKPDIVSLEPNYLDEVWSDFERVGEKLNSSDSYLKFKTEIEQRLDNLKQKSQHLINRPTVVCIEWINPLMIAANWVPELVDIAGGINMLSKPGSHSHIFKWGEILESNPDLIIMMPCEFDINRTLEEIEILKQKPDWSKLEAVKSNNVFLVDGNQYFNGLVQGS
ncbi:MAG: cobalamin-binding protein [SAR324 cluster bacterium]|nr:cobalamin-binding protein [SAR324 cluster bacterium]